MVVVVVVAMVVVLLLLVLVVLAPLLAPVLALVTLVLVLVLVVVLGWCGVRRWANTYALSPFWGLGMVSRSSSDKANPRND